MTIISSSYHIRGAPIIKFWKKLVFCTNQGGGGRPNPKFSLEMSINVIKKTQYIKKLIIVGSPYNEVEKYPTFTNKLGLDMLMIIILSIFAQLYIV